MAIRKEQLQAIRQRMYAGFYGETTQADLDMLLGEIADRGRAIKALQQARDMAQGSAAQYKGLTAQIESLGKQNNEYRKELEQLRPEVGHFKSIAEVNAQDNLKTHAQLEQVGRELEQARTRANKAEQKIRELEDAWRSGKQMFPYEPVDKKYVDDWFKVYDAKFEGLTDFILRSPELNTKLQELRLNHPIQQRVVNLESKLSNLTELCQKESNARVMKQQELFREVEAIQGRVRNIGTDITDMKTTLNLTSP